MSATEGLPDDIADQLEILRDSHGEAIESSAWCERMHELARKYAPKPKTLADHGPIKWTRWGYFGGSNHYENRTPTGVSANYVEGGAGRRGDHIPWPPPEGIDPAPLLDDGWQIRAASDREVWDWDYLRPDMTKPWSAASRGLDTVGGLANGFGDDIVVICRPPGDDT